MSEEFCDGVKILLKRMESNPEEFKGRDSKWQGLMPSTTGYPDWSHALTDEEMQALKDGLRKICRDEFTEKVMATLLHDKEEVTQGQFRITEVPPGTWVSSGSGGGGSGMLGSPYQNIAVTTSDTSIYYPRLSPYAESQPPSSSEILARTKKFLGLK